MARKFRQVNEAFDWVFEPKAQFASPPSNHGKREKRKVDDRPHKGNLGAP